MEVKAPTSVDVGAIDGAFTEMNDEQNKDKLIGLAGAYVSTLTTTGNEMTEDQKNLQMRMTDSVSRWNYRLFLSALLLLAPRASDLAKRGSHQEHNLNIHTRHPVSLISS